MRVPWIARRSNQSILKEISPEYSLEELILKLKLQYFGHLMRTTDSLEKTLILGKIECQCYAIFKFSININKYKWNRRKGTGFEAKKPSFKYTLFEIRVLTSLGSLSLPVKWG